MANFAQSLFSAADTNQDGRLDQSEFANLFGGAGGSSYGSSSYSSGGSWGGAGASGASWEGASAGGASWEGASAGGASWEGASAGGASWEGASAGGASWGAAAGGAEFGSVQVSQYAADANGNYQDPNPQVIRRAAAGGAQTYTQNIKVRFLAPPPLPPPGPLIIKEVRPPQPPAPAPLRLVQRGKQLPTPPPLVLRERPPVAPAVVQSQTVIRRLPGLPVPPRSVIIERFPPLPPRPRDIIIERWLPYGQQAKRRTIVQRAGAAKAYAAPRNVIIQYEAAAVRVVRNFQNLGVTQGNPAAYVQQYGASLLDANSLLSQARAAGVVEDLSAPGGAAAGGASFGFEAASYGQEASFEASGFGGGFGGSSSWESSSFDGGFGGSSSWESSSFSSGGAGDLFSSIDSNQDGTIDRNEFQQFFG